MNREVKRERRPTEPDPEGESSFGPGKAHGLRVLLIDDMETLLFILGNALKQQGCKVFSARSGAAGIGLFRAHPTDAVICDLGLEDIDGGEVASRICEICEECNRSKPPLILMTGLPLDLAEQEELLSSGVDIILEKPVEIPQLMEVLRRVTRP
ncbi:MAG: response regulator [Pseudomonadota bacterium]